MTTHLLKDSAAITARRFVDVHYPGCKAALLVGSSVNGTPGGHSDLDVVILNRIGPTYKETTMYRGICYEVFVMSESAVSGMFEWAVQSGTGALLRMCAEGRLLRDDGSGASIKLAARTAWHMGPPKWSIDELNKARYEITEDLLDLIDARERSAVLFTAVRLVQNTAEFILRANDQWSGVGKWLYRALRDYDPNQAARLTRAADSLFAGKQKRPLVAFVKQTLKPFGGLLHAGFREDGSI